MTFLRICTYFIFFSCFLGIAQTTTKQKELKATRITNPPKIDGILDDDVWDKLPSYGDFFNFEPENQGMAPDTHLSEVKLGYDDKAVYIAAYLYDENPDEILKQFSQRDEIFVQADHFMVAINSYNDGINETRFWVTSAGTIGDSRVTQNDQDFGFNVVFQAEISYDEKGWYVEYKIPYNTLRFPEIDIQDWSINFYRRVIHKNEGYSWNYIDREVGRETQYNGLLTNIKNVDPPTRLLFFPFGQVQSRFSKGAAPETSFSAGMDIKYGLSDSFTLDAQLIPDFGQVAFDEVVLNLGPFEQTFNENRAFFTEGIDLFNRGNIFFSRRIGGEPTGSVFLRDNEQIIEVPGTINLLNSIKVTGRTKDNLGIGILNSITEDTFATVEDTITGNRRKELAEPLTNYNVFVLDQQFNGNSSISIVNSSVIRSGSEFRDANTSAFVFDVADKKNTIRSSGRAVVSNVRDNGLTTGLRTELDIYKITGNWRYRFGHDFSNTDYDINDLGLNFRNNFNSFVVGGSYQIFEPNKIFNRYRIELTARHRRLYQPDVQTSNRFSLDSFFVLPSRTAFGGDLNFETDEDDYFEPRLDGRFVTFSSNLGGRTWISTDYRRKFAFDAGISYREFFDDEVTRYSVDFSPRYRFSDRFLLVLSSEYGLRDNEFGWVDNTETDVFLGQRNVTTIENSLNASFNFDPFKAINLRFRNFWSTADYSNDVFYLLNQDGTRSQIDFYDFENTDLNNPNRNFNIWNLDISFQWRFAPGSFATLLYRHQLSQNDNESTLGYQESLNKLFEQSLQNTLSLRVSYFIDYNNLSGLFSKKTS
ncbi:hypothetical protein GCM10009117_00890 [Gangjinia marincola]|uniref:DUF5916 domain-containing protein n=1 Tax=Gangjinia marincola TaxID=578463 RepID=A0ABP3XRM5_9FLAO